MPTLIAAAASSQCTLCLGTETASRFLLGEGRRYFATDRAPGAAAGEPICCRICPQIRRFWCVASCKSFVEIALALSHRYVVPRSCTASACLLPFMPLQWLIDCSDNLIASTMTSRAIYMPQRTTAIYEQTLEVTALPSRDAYLLLRILCRASSLVARIAAASHFKLLSKRYAFAVLLSQQVTPALTLCTANLTPALR